jgi:hypothetical protein
MIMTHSPAITLLQGYVDEELIDKCLAETRINSEDVIGALKLHFVKNWPAPMAYMAFSVKQQNFFKNVEKLNLAYKKLESDVNENISNNSKAVA